VTNNSLNNNQSFIKYEIIVDSKLYKIMTKVHYMVKQGTVYIFQR